MRVSVESGLQIATSIVAITACYFGLRADFAERTAVLDRRITVLTQVLLENGVIKHGIVATSIPVPQQRGTGIRPAFMWAIDPRERRSR